MAIRTRDGKWFRLPSRFDVPDYDDPTVTLFTRWRLLDVPWFGVYVHHLRRSDSPNRPLHDHPWSFVSFRLWRNYSEVRPNEDAWACSWWAKYRSERHRLFSFRRATDLHRVVVDDPDRGCWTLVLRGPRKREWGFQNPGEPWVPHALAGGPPGSDTKDI